MMSMEVTELLGSAQLSGHGLSFAADNLIFMRYLERQGRLDRALAIIKARGIEHGTELVELLIDAHGPRIGGPIKDLQGVLTGLPVAAECGRSSR
jgi:circadian clock protein KaiC